MDTVRRILGFAFSLRLFPVYFVIYEYLIIKFVKDYTIVQLVGVPMLVMAAIAIVEALLTVFRARRLPDSAFTPEQQVVFKRPIERWVWIVLIGCTIAAMGLVALTNYCSTLGFDTVASCWLRLVFLP